MCSVVAREYDHCGLGRRAENLSTQTQRTANSGDTSRMPKQKHMLSQHLADTVLGVYPDPLQRKHYPCAQLLEDDKRPLPVTLASYSTHICKPHITTRRQIVDGTQSTKRQSTLRWQQSSRFCLNTL